MGMHPVSPPRLPVTNPALPPLASLLATSMAMGTNILRWQEDVLAGREHRHHNKPASPGRARRKRLRRLAAESRRRNRGR